MGDGVFDGTTSRRYVLDSNSVSVTYMAFSESVLSPFGPFHAEVDNWFDELMLFDNCYIQGCCSARRTRSVLCNV